MNTKPLFATALATLCLLACQSAPAAGFIKFDGVDGESQDAGHPGWSDLESVDLSTSKDIDPATGEPTGRVRVDKFCLTKKLDKSSPVLFRASVGEDAYPKVTIEFTRDIGPGEEGCGVYLKYELTDVTIVSYKSTVDRDNPPGTEEICLSFGTLTMTYIPCTADGTPGEPVVTTFTRS